MQNPQIKVGLSSIVFLVALIYLGYVPKQSDFYQIILPYFIGFCSYLFLIKHSTEVNLKFLLVLALATRFALIFCFPNLSDDIYRFIWDGTLSQNGVNPFRYLPTEVITEYNISGIDQVNLEQLNSPNYYTIYPPISQLVFAFASYFGNSSLLTASIIFKSIFFLSELGSIFLLIKILKLLKLPITNSLWYALNPLIIIELVGNLHFECLMVFFFLGFYYSFLKSEYFKSTIWLTMSIGTKLLPLMFLPFLIYSIGLKKAIKYFSLGLVLLFFIFLPVGLGIEWSNFADSIDLYFRKFEFNASVYYFTRFLGYKLSGYNLIAYIGPGLALIALCGILTLWLKGFARQTKERLPLYFLFAFCIYLFLATTVHPWYLSLPIVLCCFTKYRFPILWSGFIMLTYINYSYGDYFENLWMVTLEYFCVFAYMIYEMKGTKKAISTQVKTA